MRVVLDTNVVSALMKCAPEPLAHLATQRPNDIVLCSPVAAEIRYGLERLEPGSRRRLALEREFDRLRDAVDWLDWTEAAADHFGQHRARLAHLGELIEDMDLAIASVALSCDAVLATGNTRHFERIEGLELVDWTIPS